MASETGAKPRRIRNISELAKLAGVSAGTVSRALAGKTFVNIDTRERIQALAREHGFRPNQMASRLRTGHTGVIGVIMSRGLEQGRRLADPFAVSLLGHLADELGANGFDVTLNNAQTDEEDWLERIVDSGMQDGLLMIGQFTHFDAIERVARDYRPLVVWGVRRDNQTHCTVGVDNVAGGRMAATHLLERGCKRIAFIGDLRGLEMQHRAAGATEAVAAAGAPSVEILQISPAGGAMAPQIAAHLAQMDPAIDGIFASTDVVAMATLRQLHETGRTVPDDVAVIGFDDLPLAMHTVPQLTTVRQDLAAGAKAMVERLVARINGEEASPLVLKPELMVRESA